MLLLLSADLSNNYFFLQIILATLSVLNCLDPDQDPHSVQTVCKCYQQPTNIHYSAVFNAMFGVHMNYVLEEQFY